MIEEPVNWVCISGLHCQLFTYFFLSLNFFFVCLLLSFFAILRVSMGLLSHSVSFILQCLLLGSMTMRTRATWANTIIGSPKNGGKCAEAALQSFHCTITINGPVLSQRSTGHGGEDGDAGSSWPLCSRCWFLSLALPQARGSWWRGLKDGQDEDHQAEAVHVSTQRPARRWLPVGTGRTDGSGWAVHSQGQRWDTWTSNKLHTGMYFQT